MAKTPYLPLYYNDLRGATQDWTDEEFGAYVRLLIYQWDRGYVPGEMSRLVKIADSAEKNWPVLSEKFTPAGNGFLKNSVMEKIITERGKFLEHQAANGQLGGRPKNNNPKITQDESQTKTQIKPKKKPLEGEDESEDENLEKDKNEKFEIEMPFTSDSFRVSWQEWKDYRVREFGRKFKSPKTEQAALSHLAKLAGGKGSRAEEIITQSIGNQWQGLFPIKNIINGSSVKNKSAGAYELLEDLRANSAVNERGK